MFPLVVDLAAVLADVFGVFAGILDNLVIRSLLLFV